jgi:HSP20 family protein
MAEKRTDVVPARQEDQSLRQGGQKGQQDQARQESRMTRGEQSLLMSPFALLQRLAGQMAGVFDDFGLGRGLLASRAARGGLQSQSSATDMTAWAPDIDLFQRGQELVVRAELPGLNADDVVVEISEDAITISGERRQEEEEERGGIYRFERNYGAFFRVIPLPAGAMVDQAKASFRNGLLEITVPAPPEQVSRGRRLQISQGGEAKNEATQGSQGTKSQAVSR